MTAAASEEQSRKEEVNKILLHPRDQHQHHSLSRFVTRITFLRLQLASGDLPAVEQGSVRIFLANIQNSDSLTRNGFRILNRSDESTTLITELIKKNRSRHGEIDVPLSLSTLEYSPIIWMQYDCSAITIMILIFNLSTKQ